MILYRGPSSGPEKGTALKPLLYLDTARLGQMLPAARDAQIDFVRLASEEPSSLYFEQFLREGYAAWPSHYRERFLGLCCWHGVTGLKHSIRRLASAPSDWEVLLASRSLSLVHLATSCMFRVCRNVLTSDLSWPTYQHIINAKASRTGNRVTTIPLRDKVLYNRWNVEDVSHFLAGAFTSHQCDGLFLPAVDHLGIRLPVRQIVEAIQRNSELRFCFVDAAQAFCHVDLDECIKHADFVVAGSHKWMGAYLPTGIGLIGQRRSRDMIDYRLRHMLRRNRVADPLLIFTEQLCSKRVGTYGQTANVANLFACAGAALERLSVDSPVGAAVSDVNRLLSTIPRPAGDWNRIAPLPGFQSKIAILEKRDDRHHRLSAIDVRQQWLEAGCIVSGYSGGRARLSR